MTGLKQSYTHDGFSNCGLSHKNLLLVRSIIQECIDTYLVHAVLSKAITNRSITPLFLQRGFFFRNKAEEETII